MQRNIIYISLPPYIAAWLRHESGSYPIRFRRSSVEFLIMEQFCINDPDLAIELYGEEKDLVAVAVPEFKYKDASYHFMTDSGRKALEQCIKDRFSILLWKGLNKFGHIGKQRKYLILAWMEAHGIPDEGSNWDSIEKRYQRQRNSYMAAARQRKSRKK